jgi:menaquinone-dependent protoporphyrinogen IX oxidase
MHIFRVFITTVQSLENVSLQVWEEMIIQGSIVYLKYAEKSTKFNYIYYKFRKRTNTPKKSHAHLCVHNNFAKFRKCQQRDVEGMDFT